VISVSTPATGVAGAAEDLMIQHMQQVMQVFVISSRMAISLSMHATGVAGVAERLMTQHMQQVTLQVISHACVISATGCCSCY
jgi:hypothetical protein